MEKVTTDDWQIGKSLTECLCHLLEEEVGCDVTFEFQSEDGTPEKLSAHRLILIARSPVFAAMFNGNFKESTENVIISDIEMHIFKEVLRYMYTDSINLTAAIVIPVLYTSKKYMLQGLQDKCVSYVEYHIDQLLDHDVCTVLNDCVSYGEDDLINNCLQFLSPRIKSVCQTNEFKNMSQDALFKLLQCNTLLPGSEINLYRACMGWARQKTYPSIPTDVEIRSCLGKCLLEIRFLLMTPKEFAEEVGVSQILTSDEKSLLYGLKLSQDLQYRSKLSDLGFNLTERVLKCDRLTSLSNNFRANSEGENEIFHFEPNQNIKLLGFSVLLGDLNSVITVKMYVYYREVESTRSARYIDKNAVPDAQAMAQLTSDGSGQPYPVYLNKQLDVSAQGWVMVKASITGKTRYGFDETSKSIAAGGVTFQLTTEGGWTCSK